MWAIQLYNRQGDYLGLLSDEFVEVSEYEAYPLHLHLNSDLDVRDFDMYVDGKRLQRRGNVFTFGSGEGERGRIGTIAFNLFFRGAPHATVCLAITQSHFSAEQYQFLINDLKHLLSLASQDSTAVRSNEGSWQLLFVDVYDRRLQALSTYIEQLKRDIARIESAPHRSVGKQYHLERAERAQRVDARTVRWLSTHPTPQDGKVLTYTNVEHYNLYENRFLVHILKWLLRYLDELPRRFAYELVRHTEDISHRIAALRNAPELLGEDGAIERRQFRMTQLSQLERVQQTLADLSRERLPAYRQQTSRYAQEIVRLQQRPFLQNLTHNSAFTVNPTLKLQRDPAYSAVYDRYQKIQHELQTEEQQKFEAMIDLVPIERTSKLYEYWVFLQVYQELRRRGFRDADASKGIWSMIDNRTFRLKSNSHVRLVGDTSIYRYAKPLEVCLHYEHRFGDKGGLCPDIFIEFIQTGSKIFILDVKYRDYDAQGYQVYLEDRDGTANQKYKHLKRQRSKDTPWEEITGVDGLREKIAASFIVHSHSDDQRFRDYGSASHRNEYGAIPLVPDEQAFNVANLQRLFTMFMRMHLKLFHICWSPEHDQPVRAQQKRRFGGSHKEWEGEYHCPSCDNRWWVNHCGHWCQGDTNNVAKVTFADPSENFFEIDATNQRLKCASCNRSYSIRM